jgi:AraC family transcriptional regulator of arabinose operon
VKIPKGATSFCPPVAPLHAGHFRSTTIRHTFRPQGTRDWLLIYTQGGSGLYRFPGGSFESQAGDLTLYRPDFFQDYQFSPSARKWDLAYAHFLPRPEWLPWLNWPEKSPGLMTLSLKGSVVAERISKRLQEMLRLVNGSQPRWQIFGLNALEEIFLWCDSINPRQAQSQPDPRILRALDFLTTRLAEPFSEHQLARVAGLSPSRLRHLFRLETGDSPRHFLEQQRLLRACDLLALSRQTIGEIALELGFSNPFYFTLRFKKQTGESPRAFRQRITAPAATSLKTAGRGKESHRA